jgi:uncharacterized membrane protein
MVRQPTLSMRAAVVLFQLASRIYAWMTWALIGSSNDPGAIFETPIHP